MHWVRSAHKTTITQNDWYHSEIINESTKWVKILIDTLCDVIPIECGKHPQNIYILEHKIVSDEVNKFYNVNLMKLRPYRKFSSHNGPIVNYPLI